MVRDVNKVMIIGRLGADPVMRFTQQGIAVTNFRVASGRQWKDRDGQVQEETEWFRIQAWNKLGEICNEYLRKGARVYVEGRFQTRTYIDRDGQERSSTEVVASEMIMLDGRREGTPMRDEDAPFDNEEAPAPATSRPPVQAGPRTRWTQGRTQSQSIGEDDIPF